VQVAGVHGPAGQGHVHGLGLQALVALLGHDALPRLGVSLLQFRLGGVDGLPGGRSLIGGQRAHAPEEARHLALLAEVFDAPFLEGFTAGDRRQRGQRLAAGFFYLVF
jgi:hypothetical protein